MHHLTEAVHEHGDLVYLLTTLWTFFEGETFVLFGGFLASQGLVDPWLFGVCAALGSFAGDQAWFLIGRLFGRGIIERRPRWRAGLDRAFLWVKRWGTLFILSFRFIYGVRNFASVALGMSRIGWSRFASLNLAAAALWAAAFVGSGYLFGRWWGKPAADALVTTGPWTLAGFVLVVGAVVVVRRWPRTFLRGSLSSHRKNLSREWSG